jgi:S1-C subfamily serine protease
MTMRYVLAGTVLVALAIDAVGASAQGAGCRDCDTVTAVLVPARDRVLAEQFVRMSAEIQRLRTELSRTSAADSSSARSLRTTIESLVMSQRHLEEAMREHAVLVRARERQGQGQGQGQEGARTVVARARSGTLARSGYVGLTTEARYTLRESGGGRVQQVVEFPVIVTVAPGSPAARAGLSAGDTVIAVGSVDGRRLEQELGSLLRPGQTLQFRVRRGDDVRVMAVQVGPARAGTFTVNEGVATGRAAAAGRFEETRAATAERLARATVISSRPAPAIGATVVPLRADESAGAARVMIYREPTAIAGARLAPLQHDLAAKLGVEHGLYVLTVGPATPGARAGLEAGDVIIGAAEHPLTSIAQLHDLMSSSSTGSLTLRIVRDKEQRLVTVRW